MRYLLDTNIVSNFTKPVPSDALIAWMAEQSDEDLFITSLTLAEIRRGVLEKPPGKRRDQLDAWFSGPHGPQALFAGRILPFDAQAGLIWARLMADGKAAGRPRNSLDWLLGYKPAFNFQSSLVDAVVRWLDSHGEWIARVPVRHTSTRGYYLEEERTLWIGPPPTQSNQLPPNELERMSLIAQKFDVAARDARNRALGRLGEEMILTHEDAVLRGEGRPDLAREIRWVAEVDGDGAGYDIRSFTADGRERLIEVKTTNGWDRTPFYLTRNEVNASQQFHDDWALVRLWNFSRTPRAFEIRPPLQAHLSLIATTYQATVL